MNGKGSKRRPQLVPDTTFGDNWEKIFKQSRHIEKEKKMGQFRCDRCEETSDSKGGDAIEDPNNNHEMIHESCLTDKEIDEQNNRAYFGGAT